MESPDSSARQIGLRIARLREARSMTQTELSIRSGIPYQTISYIENGKRNPSMPTLRKLASALGVSLHEIQPEELDQYGEPLPADLRLLNDKIMKLPVRQRQAIIRTFSGMMDNLSDFFTPT